MRINSPVAGMRAPCAFSGKKEAARRSRSQDSIHFQWRREISKGAKVIWLIHLVKSAEAGVGLLAHVALWDRRIGLAKVDDYQSIHDVGKFAVEIESHQLAAHLVILPDQDRQTF